MFFLPFYEFFLDLKEFSDQPLKRLAALYNSDSRAHESSKNACLEVFESKDLFYPSIKQS